MTLACAAGASSTGARTLNFIRRLARAKTKIRPATQTGVGAIARGWASTLTPQARQFPLPTRTRDRPKAQNPLRRARQDTGVAQLANGEADSGEACALRPLHAAACLRATGRGLHRAQTVHQTACVRARRQYLIRFRDLLAPNAKRCAQTVPAASGDDRRASEPAAAESANAHSRQARISRARLLKRVFQIDLERCPNGGD